MSRPDRRDAEPLEIDERVPVGIGVACWVIALVVLLLIGDRLPNEGRWWIWTCVVGITGGAFGYWYVPYLKRKRGMDE